MNLNAERRMKTMKHHVTMPSEPQVHGDSRRKTPEAVKRNGENKTGSKKPEMPELVAVKCMRCERALCRAPLGTRIFCNICHRWHIVIMDENRRLTVKEWPPEKRKSMTKR